MGTIVLGTTEGIKVGKLEGEALGTIVGIAVGASVGESGFNNGPTETDSTATLFATEYRFKTFAAVFKLFANSPEVTAFVRSDFRLLYTVEGILVNNKLTIIR